MNKYRELGGQFGLLKVLVLCLIIFVLSSCTSSDDSNKPDLDTDTTDYEQVDDTQDYDNTTDETEDITDNDPVDNDPTDDDEQPDDDNAKDLEATLSCEQDSTYLNKQNCYVDTNAENPECTYAGTIVPCDDFTIDNYETGSEATVTVEDLYDNATVDAKTTLEGEYEKATIGECILTASAGNYAGIDCPNFGPENAVL